MRILSTTLRSAIQSKKWQNKLDDIVSADTNSGNIVQLNNKKKSLGISGLGTILFGELFKLDTHPEVAYVTSAFNLYSSHIDCHLDGTYGLGLSKTATNDIDRLLNYAIDYLEGGSTDNELLLEGRPLVDYVRHSILSRDQQAMSPFCAHVREYADSVNNDFSLDDPEMRMRERIKLGESYGAIISNLLDIFSRRKLTDKQGKSIRIYSACGALHDDFVDLFEDGSKSYVLKGSKSTRDTLFKIYHHRKNMHELFKEGNYLMENQSQRKDYNRMFNALILGGDMFFIKKGIEYLTKRISNSK